LHRDAGFIDFGQPITGGEMSINPKRKEPRYRLGRTDDLSSLGKFVADLVGSLQPTDEAPYPILGAEGSTIVIVVAAGPIETHWILKDIHIELDRNRHDLSVDFTSSTGTELRITVQDGAAVIALLGLLQRALDAKTAILHPLDGNGDYLKGWEEACLTAAGLKRP
jgi:hypothetical protein